MNQQVSRATRGLRSPISVIVRVAAMVDAAIERHPGLVTRYVNAQDDDSDRATAMLWTDIVRDDAPVPEVWRRLRHGVIADVSAARHALLLLVICDGWHRIKVCVETSCVSPFADATNGMSRRRCAMHTRGHSKPREAAETT
ncbi:hypothetical protein HTZ77_16775 [Nonomuraea sp. SMC257]|uniref:CGNR zinc finger domain-containing protein n=1 Tax=Nonomuraea montanisoli TaxID=2741721 RepID=A0A7Y6I7L0_9ACTN|nr:hypothetical protein [Nonomuraea montanisoli]NUW33074.1 hypothetical protein [Nonomuraea montanisoli]